MGRKKRGGVTNAVKSCMTDSLLGKNVTILGLDAYLHSVCD